MHQTTMKVLALVCLAIAVLEVAPDPCGGQRGPPQMYIPVYQQPNPGNQQTNPGQTPASAGTTGRRKRNAENDNPPPPPHDHPEEQGKKDQPPPRPHGDKVSVKSKSVQGSVSGQTNSASHSASFAHKAVQMDNKKSNSNSLKMGLPGLQLFDAKSDSNTQSSLNLNSMQGEQKGTRGHTKFEGKKGSDSVNIRLGGVKPKPDLTKSSSALGQGAHGLAGGYELAKNSAGAGQGTHALAGGSDSVKNAAGGKSEVHAKQGHSGLLGDHKGKFGSAHELALNANTKALQDAQVQGASANLHKTHGSSAGGNLAAEWAKKGVSGAAGAASSAASHGVNLGKKQIDLAASAAQAGASMAKTGVDGAEGAASSAASHGANLGKKQIDLAASAAQAGASVAKTGVDGAVGAGTAAGIHATHGLMDAESARNVAGAVTGGMQTHPAHKAAIEAVHHGKKELENGASGKAKLDIRLKTK